MNLFVNTGGGDAPGLNAVVRAVVLAALGRGWRVTGIRHGYEGLIGADPDGLVDLGRETVRGITCLGGSILGVTNRGDPFGYPEPSASGTLLTDRSDDVLGRFRELGGGALVAIGGDGSMRIAQRLMAKGLPVVGVPKTIDNDLCGTEYTFGFDTAVSIATEAIDRLHSTAEAHRRVMVVEVMGRYAGWIALHAGIAGTADAILIPEIEYDIGKLCDKIRDREESGRHFALVVAAEGARRRGGELSVAAAEAGREVRLGGIAAAVAQAIARETGKETRSLVLGHLQRGGGPTAFDRTLALRFGAAAVRVVARGDFGKMVAYIPPAIRAVSIDEAVRTTKTVPLDSDLIATARDLGVSFGD